MKITKKRFKEVMGVKPTDYDMDRVNCPAAGEMGHWLCGWCETCNKPRFMCPCVAERNRAVGIITVNIDIEGMMRELRPVTIEDINKPVVDVHPPDRRGAEPMTEVELEIARADMAYLKQQEIDSGDWDKWLKDQGMIPSGNGRRS